MRLSRFFALFLLLLACACTSRTEQVLPLSRSIVGASQVKRIELVVTPQARASIAAMDERALQKKAVGGYAAAPFAQLLPDMIMEATRRAGLTSGRELKLQIEVDEFDTASAGAAIFGREDRLAGTVFVTDAGTGEALGQLYVDVNARASGLIGLATRGGVRERIAEAFATRIANALSGR
ncbi:MAG: hypothetical protein AVDCRST_MAG23-1717 [uncultured Sphingosinicella sp.]|uniref:DUF4410 domain-containing protein n=1 Tax=uncultured Sphingosinicella sp. TaxID=478748 RepID=A0A6J4U2A6_9SPHN|nr:hypothetical protein [uncultured Sphingosinicella sp.]CAA9538861.1 MAG: hypothetical protein AVDCRST_MAG23-1717 [uncultured Sphingosinicella sp.]